MPEGTKIEMVVTIKIREVEEEEGKEEDVTSGNQTVVVEVIGHIPESEWAV